MSCCAPIPPITPSGAALLEGRGVESDIRVGETVECYSVRAGNLSGLHDDATANVNNQIENASIPITRSKTAASVSVQFRLTDGSTRTATSWSVDVLPPGISLSSSGLFSGTFSSPGTKYQIRITANDVTGIIDTRAFTLAPSIGGEGNQIQLISPLPGAIVNSKFGPRLHPIQKVMKMHAGIDMKFANRSVADCVAAADGVISLAGGDASRGYGLRVWIKHLTATGNHLCTTTYNHLAKIYVQEGQKVIAGQKIGLEGSTGGSTGNHLHFECRLPDGKFIDPEPLIRGDLSVARSTSLTGDAINVETRTSTASLSETEVQAKQESCAAFGPTYPPATPPETSIPANPAPPINDPFELAWFFTLTQEVGPQWNTSSPADPDVIAGAIATKAQRLKVGYVNIPNFPGGETKFGVAQNPNPKTNVLNLTYAQAKTVGFNNYWTSAPISCAGALLTNAPLVSIMLFDMNYLHGGGNARTIFQNANLNITSPKTQAEQQALCRTLNTSRLAFIRNIRDLSRFPGWITRANECLAYVLSLPTL